MRVLNALRNQWLVSRAWMFSTVMFALFSGYLLITLGSTVKDMPTRLIPYEFDAMTGPVEVSSSGRASGEYLARIAESDLKNYTDWTPRTVKRAYGAFANRMAPQLYAQIGADLIAHAETIAASERTQAFFIDKTEALEKENTVRITGTLQVWQGSERIASNRVIYTISYRFSRGVPVINTFKSEGGR